MYKRQTYDGLVLKLVSLEQQVAASQIDRQFQEEILQSFRNVDSVSYTHLDVYKRQPW